MNESSIHVILQRRTNSLRSAGVILLMPVVIGCSGGADSGPTNSKPPAQTAPSELEKDSTLSQPPKLAPPQ